MKNLILFIVLTMTTIAVKAQSYTQKYNSLYDRTEFFDSRGTMVGYAKENTLYDRIEYFDARGNMIKYEKQNTLYDRKETYDQRGNQQGYEK